MNYDMVDTIMANKKLATNPAFDDLRIGIEPIQCYNSCPLGLYFPVEELSPHLQTKVPGGTIIIPPEAAEGTFLHELGHRHGHYYHGDLSELYAENFRKRYQKGKALLYAGSDFSRLPELGKLFEEGERGAIEVALLQQLAPDELHEIKSILYSYPETPPRVYYGHNSPAWLRVEFTQGINWPAILGPVIAGVTVLTAAALGYALYKTAEDLPWIFPATLFGFGMFIVLKSISPEIKRLAVGR